MHLVPIVAVSRNSKPRIVLFGGTDPEFLGCAREQITDHVAGRLDHPTAKARLRKFLGARGYQPAPGDKGTINDFEGDERLDLILQANFRLERGYLRWEKGQTKAMLEAWPAQEVVALSNGVAYAAAWAAAGGVMVEDRMIALLDDPVWEKFSPFGLPYEPFALDGSLRVRGLLRTEWVGLNPFQAEPHPKGLTRSFAEDLEIAETRCDEILRGLAAGALPS